MQLPRFVAVEPETQGSSSSKGKRASPGVHPFIHSPGMLSVWNQRLDPETSSRPSVPPVGFQACPSDPPCCLRLCVRCAEYCETPWREVSQLSVACSGAQTGSGGRGPGVWCMHRDRAGTVPQGGRTAHAEMWVRITGLPGGQRAVQAGWRGYRGEGPEHQD